MPYSRVSVRGQVVIPKAVRDELRLEVGDTVEIEVENGKAVMTPKRIQVVAKAPAPKLTAAEQRTLSRAQAKIDEINRDLITSTGLTTAEANIAAKVGLIDVDQRWWWLESWQKGERAAEEDIRENRRSGPFDTADAAIAYLKSAKV